MNTPHNGNGIGDPPGRSGAKHESVLRKRYFAPFTPPAREIPFLQNKFKLNGRELTANGEHFTAMLAREGRAGSPPGENVQDQNNQEFLDFLNTATTQMRVLLEKQSRLRRTPIKAPLAEGR